MATQAQGMGSVKDIQKHLRHSRADTTANEYIEALPASVQEKVGSIYLTLMKGGENEASQASSRDLLRNPTKSSMEPAVSH